MNQCSLSLPSVAFVRLTPRTQVPRMAGIKFREAAYSLSTVVCNPSNFWPRWSSCRS